MRLFDALLALLYPPRCPFCRRLVQRDELVCPECAKNLPYTDGMGRTQKFPFIAKCASPLYYEGSVRQSLLRYKFHSAAAYSKIYGEFLVKCIDECRISCDIITWVPLSRRRLRKRGYDQARLIAEEVSRRTGISCAPLLRKKRDNPAQSGAGSTEKRRANVLGVYAPAEGAAISGRRVLIVDDIVTTGATLSECAKVLKGAGAAEVYAAAIARRRD